MDSKVLQSISSQVYRRFPEVKGSQPKVQAQHSGRERTAEIHYLIIYRGRATAADGKSIPRIVRVVASNEGKILKFTTSR